MSRETAKVTITIALNTNQKSTRTALVEEIADLSSLWGKAKSKLKLNSAKKLHTTGKGSIHLVRTGLKLQDGDKLQQGDVLLESQGEPVDLAESTIRQPIQFAEGIPDYLLVLDFEATCNEKGPAPKPQEIIEFPTVVLNVKSGQVEEEFHHYIRPDVNPLLSSFCTELTGITQETVDNGISLADALVEHQSWLGQKGLSPLAGVEQQPATGQQQEEIVRPTFLYLTCGDWDIKTCLPNQLRYHGAKLPPAFHQWINIKKAFYSHYGKKAGGMTCMLDELGIELKGRHHSGIDDCRNIARICQVMLQDGWEPTSTSHLPVSMIVLR